MSSNINRKYVTQFKIFEKFPEITCGVIGKPFGVATGFDKNYQIGNEKNLNKIINFFKIRDMRIMQQVHGSHIYESCAKDQKKVIVGADGLSTTDKNLFLIVKVSDCVPIFFYEPTTSMIGVAHAGWRGSLQNIAGKMVSDIVRHGGRVEKLVVAIGPYIHDCCYNVVPSRFRRFKKRLSGLKFEKPNFLDLGQICAFQMLKLGVPAKNIEISKICTRCSANEFYSFRGGDKSINNTGVIVMKY